MSHLDLFSKQFRDQKESAVVICGCKNASYSKSRNYNKYNAFGINILNLTKQCDLLK